MGFPIIKETTDLKAAILELSVSDRAMLIAWIADSIMEGGEASETTLNIKGKDEKVSRVKGFRTADNPNNVTSITDDIPKAGDLDESEKTIIAKQLFGAWKDSTPDDLAKQIISERTIETRKINYDA